MRPSEARVASAALAAASHSLEVASTSEVPVFCLWVSVCSPALASSACNSQMPYMNASQWEFASVGRFCRNRPAKVLHLLQMQFAGA